MKEIAAIPASLILYESPGRLADAIAERVRLLAGAGIAAGLLAKAGFELVEAMHLEALEGSSLWTISSGPLASGWVHDFLAGMFGWTADEATPLRVGLYVAYLVPITWFFYFGGRTPKVRSNQNLATA